MKNPNELITELKDFIASIEKDADKASRGMKAAGIRLRASMQQVRDLAIATRKSVLEFRNTSSDAVETDELEAQSEENIEKPKIVEKETVYANEENVTKLIDFPKSSSYWYSDFNY